LRDSEAFQRPAILLPLDGMFEPPKLLLPN
jgi:hypothetical protein